MKSSVSQLRGRGFLRDEDLDASRHLSAAELTRQLDSTDAVERSAAVRLLSRAAGPDASLDQLFVERLTRETKLYTKLELCEALQAGGQETAQRLIPLLGAIGRNQHEQPSTEAFKKTSYPLPRDIVARVLARMDPVVLPPLIAAVVDGPRTRAVEAIDAVGFLCFYSAVTTPDRLAALNALTEKLRGNPDDELMQWKIVRALESFNHPNAKLLLERLVAGSTNPVIVQEAQRSLALVVEQPAL
ncbi:hypothetical protein I6E68_12680 [Salinibacterium sp. NSLL150]|uniref:hypothetical protein n=1 Tax=unclassified Salinibacterium TaxID=2632331 RepID=UPI0018CE0D9E|nr:MULTISPECIES: hypothetical protein [unclassified Salinibacterium]MBH0099989.1 hypothetical protein [Salinibacterium sp. NSLL35]MBH0102743.1 hypothetical protein [Salinibacterium sp. NSLL150]MBH0105503.1 hypothetical protein [Salinibacterium sp. NSLL16]MBH0108263.1 hypothetical protein [Salinibacterium sp. NSLL17]MBH0117193.1 hypothetical protein [Salinibacterium sp. NG253]